MKNNSAGHLKRWKHLTKIQFCKEKLHAWTDVTCVYRSKLVRQNNYATWEATTQKITQRKSQHETVFETKTRVVLRRVLPPAIEAIDICRTFFGRGRQSWGGFWLRQSGFAQRKRSTRSSRFSVNCWWHVCILHLRMNGARWIPEIVSHQLEA